MWSVWRRCQQGSWTLAVRALQRRSRGMRRRTRAGRSAGMLAGEVLTPNISARRQAQLSTLRRPRDGLGMRGGSSRPLLTQPKCTSRRGHRHRRGASCRCAGAARAAKRPAVRSTRRPRPASCTRTLWGTSGRTRRSPQSCETGTGGAGRARGTAYAMRLPIFPCTGGVFFLNVYLLQEHRHLVPAKDTEAKTRFRR